MTLRARKGQRPRMARQTDASPAFQSPWWLQDGHEECPHCGQPYHLERERRCAGCDSPSCADCHDSQAGHCAGCHAEETPP